MLPAGAIAQGKGGEFPQRSIRFVVGFPPAGTTDILARAIAQRTQVDQLLDFAERVEGDFVVHLQHAGRVHAVGQAVIDLIDHQVPSARFQGLGQPGQFLTRQ